MDEIERLQNALKYRRAKIPNRTVRLGQVAQQLMTERISPRQARFGPVAELWGRLLPDELARHCEIVDISGGQLKVQVDSPAYMYELQLCSSELLKELQQQCPKARLTKIKLVVA
jgi:predicted nucleic acid-binding Zn ribbon protein